MQTSRQASKSSAVDRFSACYIPSRICNAFCCLRCLHKFKQAHRFISVDAKELFVYFGSGRERFSRPKLITFLQLVKSEEISTFQHGDQSDVKTPGDVWYATITEENFEPAHESDFRSSAPQLISIANFEYMAHVKMPFKCSRSVSKFKFALS